MSERWLALMVAAVWIGAWVGRHVGSAWLVIGVGVVLLAVATTGRRVWLVIVAVGVLSVGRAAHAEQHYVAVASGSYTGWVRLVTDPEPGRFGTNAEVAIEDGRRVQLSTGWDVVGLDALEAGEAVFVTGRLRQIDPSDWARSRHLTGRLSADDLGARSGVRWWGRPSQWLRGAVQAGAELLPRDAQALYTGLVIGDDRFQSAGQQARFRAAGLSHLLAVSGQNVAFVLAVASPLIGRLGWWSRWSATVGVLVVFAMATRLEPSVLRATGTALASVWALSSGARASGVRALALAVTALVLIDPFLVWSVGFRLSLAASAGILVIGPVIESRLPDTWWRTPLTVTLGAQAGVTPLLVTTFGPVAVISVPANLAAGWSAGLVMTWGLTGGLVAAIVGEVLGAGAGGVVQWPAFAAMWWIDAVATVALRVPSPVLGTAVGTMALVAAVTGWFLGPTTTVGRWVCAGIAGILLASTVPRPPDSAVDLVGGGRYWPAAEGTPSLLVASAGADERLIEAVLGQRVGSIDVVVLESGGRTMSSLAVELGDVATIGVVLAPPQHRVVGGRRLLAPMVLDVGDGQITIRPVSDDRLAVEATP